MATELESSWRSLNRVLEDIKLYCIKSNANHRSETTEDSNSSNTCECWGVIM